MKLRPILFLALSAPIYSAGLLAAPPLYSAEDNDLVRQYIAKYQQYAVAEMERMGIPASIKLSQGIQESGYGQSQAAVEANNHFGIKCHSGWSGEMYYHSTGEYINGAYATAGNVCFRRYGSVLESYQDHSNFLASRAHYNSLFKLQSTDCVGWAEGLKKAGYATDPDYDKKLLNLIRQYDLSKLDRAVNSVFLSPVSPAPAVSSTMQSQSAASIPTNNNQDLQTQINELKERVKLLETLLTESQKHMRFLGESQKDMQDNLLNLQKKQVEIFESRQDHENKITALDETMEHQYAVIQSLQRDLLQAQTIQQNMLRHDPFRRHFNEDGTPVLNPDLFLEEKLNSDGVFYANNRKATLVQEGQNMMNIANSFGLTYTELLKTNDMEDGDDLGVYPANFYVYLERKGNICEQDGLNQHYVAANENMYLISQRYGVRLARLLQMNGMKKGEEPQIGEFIFLKENAPEKPKLRTTLVPQAVSDFDGGGTEQDK